MRNNAWVALAIALGIILLSFVVNALFITITTPDGEVIEGNLFHLEEGTNITITGSDATNTITISATGSAATGIDVELNGTVAVTGTQVLDFLDPFNVVDDGGDAQVSLPLADDSVFVGDASSVPVATAWPDCDLGFQATTYSTGSNAIGCQFIPTTYRAGNSPISTWSIPGWTCGQIADTTVNGFQNDIIYGLIVPSATMSVTTIGINVTNAGGGGTIARLGVYEATPDALGWIPGTLVVDAGTVAIDSTGVKSIVISETLEQGRPYFTAFVHDAAALGVHTCNGDFIRTMPLTGWSTTDPSGSFIQATLIDRDAGTGAFSTTAPTPDESDNDTRSTIIKFEE